MTVPIAVSVSFFPRLTQESLVGRRERLADDGAVDADGPRAREDGCGGRAVTWCYLIPEKINASTPNSPSLELIAFHSAWSNM
ncbi:hypothetical protein nbrc107696_43530 [Gordonia spumicola]|uniref:Uncharacterized protein n=1 Tax=Gordonia spumicola TaxID=589161 RepID=A0A7I9VF04_9ACTN|nr:hypothetical protein nbrc107696_43530 [Gordonia spumicola]